MNKATIYILVLFFFIVSCEKSKVLPDPPIIVVPDDTTVVLPKYFHENTWIYEQMRLQYLWADDMPDEKSTDKNLEPVEYFYSLLRKDVDRYSYASSDYQEILDYWNGQLESYGFRYKKVRVDGEFGLAVSLVLKNSPAELGGLKRGDLIVAIDGEPLNPENAERLLERKGASFLIKNDEEYRLSLAKQKFQVDPLQFAEIIPWQGKKVGYLVYTQFLFEYEERTRALFQYFKDQQIDEMIIDLRFNPGGVTPNAEVMASLLGPDLGSSVELFHGTGNTYSQQQSILRGESPVGRRYFTNETSNLSHLSRLFVLTSKSTASSSELVINCLRPYRAVYTVGGYTYGKNLISTIIYDETGRYSFGLMPAWATLINAHDQSTYGKDGLIPDFPILEDEWPYMPLGDTTETLLRTALYAISPGESKKEFKKIEVLDGFHHWDTGKGFLGNKRYNP